MSQWDIKNLNALHSAIGRRIKKQTLANRTTVKLIEIKNGVAMSMGHPAQELSECREKLCEVCRSAQMYECDVETGWSQSCVFMKNNE